MADHARSLLLNPRAGWTFVPYAVGKAQRIVDSTRRPQREGVENLLRRGILAEPISEIGVPCLIAELDGSGAEFEAAGSPI